MCSLRDPHSHGGSQTSRWCRRPLGGGWGSLGQEVAVAGGSPERSWQQDHCLACAQPHTNSQGVRSGVGPLALEGVGGTDQGRCLWLWERKRGAVSAGRGRRRPASRGSCPPLGAPPPSGDLRCRCTCGRAGPRRAGSLSLGAFPPRAALCSGLLHRTSLFFRARSLSTTVHAGQRGLSHRRPRRPSLPSLPEALSSSPSPSAGLWALGLGFPFQPPLPDEGGEQGDLSHEHP